MVPQWVSGCACSFQELTSKGRIPAVCCSASAPETLRWLPGCRCWPAWQSCSASNSLEALQAEAGAAPMATTTTAQAEAWCATLHDQAELERQHDMPS